MTKAAAKNNETGPAKVQSHRGGRPEGSKNYCKAEIRALILAMKEIVPLKPGEWDLVVETHAKKWPGRDSNSIRRKCKALLKKARFEKSPHCSWETKMLKKIRLGFHYKRYHGVTPEISDEEKSCAPTTAGQEVLRQNAWPSYHITTKASGNREAIPSKIFLPGPNMVEDEAEVGGKQNSRYYSKAETRDLLLAMQAILPMKRYEWEYLAQAHAKKWPGREVKSIRRKFYALCKKQSRKPLADQSWEVRMADHVMYGIFDKEEFGSRPKAYNKVKAIWSASAPEGALAVNELVAVEENEDVSVVSDSTEETDEDDWDYRLAAYYTAMAVILCT